MRSSAVGSKKAKTTSSGVSSASTADVAGRDADLQYELRHPSRRIREVGSNVRRDLLLPQTPRRTPNAHLSNTSSSSATGSWSSDTSASRFSRARLGAGRRYEGNRRRKMWNACSGSRRFRSLRHAVRSISIYYKENAFCSWKTSKLHSFFAAIGPTNKALIATIDLSYIAWEKIAKFRGLAGLEGLREIRNWGWYRYAPVEYIIPAVSLQDLMFPHPNINRGVRFILCCRGRTVADREKCEAKDGSFDCWVNDTPADEQCGRRG